MQNNIVICGCYIPPDDNKYYDNHFVKLETIIIATAEKEGSIAVCGDFNSRIGSIRQLNDFTYEKNPNKITNKHGKRLLEICQDHNLLFLNHLQTETRSFPSGFTSRRNNLKSQNDWIIISKKLVDNVTNFELKTEYILTDHTPIAAEIVFHHEITIKQVLKSINDISSQRNNHSQVKQIAMKKVNNYAFTNVMSGYINKIHETHLSLLLKT